MKLINYKKLKEQIFKLDMRIGPRGLPFRQQIYDAMDKSLVDPADLGLGVLGMWGKLKKHIARGKKNCDRANEPCVYSLYAVIENIIADLESGLNLGEMRKIREEARAWEKIFNQCLTSAQLRGVACQKNTPIAHLEKTLAQAQAELEADGKEKGDKTDE